MHKIKLSYKASATRYSIEVEKESRKFGHVKTFFLFQVESKGRCHNFSWVVTFHVQKHNTLFAQTLQCEYFNSYFLGQQSSNKPKLFQVSNFLAGLENQSMNEIT